MPSYSLADILAQQIPDPLMLDIALHFQANDNRCASQQFRQMDTRLERPSHSFDTAEDCPKRCKGGHGWIPHVIKADGFSERLGALWNRCRTATTLYSKDAASWMSGPLVACALDGQPG
jgi:hypothetical protein